MVKKKIDEISLFLPSYNEQDVIAETVSKSDKVMRKYATTYEILVINDGSTDNTAKIVTDLTKKNKNIRLITHKPNRGYGGAFKTGLKESKYDWVSFIDADGQFDYSELNKFIPHMKDNDLVIGFRIDRQDSLPRKLNALLWKLWMWMLFGHWVKDTDCGFKVVKKEVAQRIKCITESALTESEFLIRAKHAGYRFKQIGVHHYPRTTGTATGANPKVILKAITESLKLWYVLNFQEGDDNAALES